MEIYSTSDIIDILINKTDIPKLLKIRPYKYNIKYTKTKEFIHESAETDIIKTKLMFTNESGDICKYINKIIASCKNENIVADLNVNYTIIIGINMDDNIDFSIEYTKNETIAYIHNFIFYDLKSSEYKKIKTIVKMYKNILDIKKGIVSKIYKDILSNH
jgi:hypothetical protein